MCQAHGLCLTYLYSQGLDQDLTDKVLNKSLLKEREGKGLWESYFLVGPLSIEKVVLWRRIWI